MSGIGNVTVKVDADTSDAVRKIRALRGEAQTPPLEVLLVAEKTPFWRGLLTAVLLNLTLGFSGGFALMLLLPLATRTFHLSHLGPGYWPCVWLIVLSRVVRAHVFTPDKPIASQKRAS